jgi:hypothetical protein
LSYFFSNYYKNLFLNDEKNFLNQNSFTLNNGFQKNSLILLDFLENSYFWYLKRFYLFNNLSNNLIKSNLKFINLEKNYNKNNVKLNEFNNLRQFFLNFYLKINFNNSFFFSHFNYNFFLKNFVKKNNNFFNESSRIYFLLNNENDFLNKDNLNFFY